MYKSKSVQVDNKSVKLLLCARVGGEENRGGWRGPDVQFPVLPSPEAGSVDGVGTEDTGG